MSPPRSVTFSRASTLSALAVALGGCVGAPPPSEPDSTTGEAQPLGEAPRVRQLVLGRAHGCSLDSAISGVLCWGDDSHGQTKVPLLVDVVSIAAGGDVSCAISLGGVKCWGDNAHRQLAVPRGLRGATQLAVGDTHVCALLSSGAVRCWGDDTYGQRSAPKLRNVTAIAAGARHTCALVEGDVTCWGDNSLGQLDVPALSDPTQLAVGGSHSCVIDDEEIVCWGGDSPALLEEIPSVTAPSALAAGSAHTCVADESGVQCWGDPEATDLTPRELTNVQELAVGGGGSLAHACARHQQGIACWGDDSLGQTSYDGFPLHVLFRSESEIDAPAALVWDILMDLESYPLWNPYTVEMTSTLRVGDPMVMMVKMSELLTIEQTEHIRVLEEGHKVCWGIETDTPEFNSGERCQWLEELPDGRTRYVTEDLIEGVANPLVLVLFGDAVRVGFDGVAKALKERAETLQRLP